MPTRTYSAKEVYVTFDGYTFTGFMDGDFLSAAQSEPDYQMKTGSDGEVSFERINNPSGTVAVTLMQTSAGNDYLTSWHQTSKLQLAKVGVLDIRDNSGRSIINARNVKLERFPETAFAKEIGGREWTFLCADLDIQPRGN